METPVQILNRIYSKYSTNASDIERRYKDLKGKTTFTKQTLYNIEDGRTKSITANIASILKEVFPDLNFLWLTSGKGEMTEIDNPFVRSDIEPDNTLDKKADAMQQLAKVQNKSTEPNQNEGFVPDKSIKVKCYTTVIPVSGQAGLFQVVYDDTYIEQNFVKEEIWVLPSERDNYTDLGVSGDSMYPTLQDNDRVRCKDIQRSFWRDESIFKDKIYSFWHNKRGIIYKRVKRYINGLLTLSSDNPDKKQFPDFEIDIDHCSRILVITELVSRKNI